MSKSFFDGDETRYFLCTGQVVKYSDLHKYPNAHILGHLVERSDEGRKVTGMMLWRNAEPTDKVPPVNPRKKSVLIGDVREICCELCEREQRWEIGLAGFLILMRHWGERVEKLEKNAEKKLFG